MIGRFLKRLKIELSCDPAISLLVIYILEYMQDLKEIFAHSSSKLSRHILYIKATDDCYLTSHEWCQTEKGNKDSPHA
jgi:hypothetical protein